MKNWGIFKMSSFLAGVPILYISSIEDDELVLTKLLSFKYDGKTIEFETFEPLSFKKSKIYNLKAIFKKYVGDTTNLSDAKSLDSKFEKDFYVIFSDILIDTNIESPTKIKYIFNSVIK